VRLAADGQLHVEVVDDGGGIPAGSPPGVGMAAMRERATEIGGDCTVAPAATGGTRVMAILPLDAS
jgi:signal transduction histidine kinase